MKPGSPLRVKSMRLLWRPHGEASDVVVATSCGHEDIWPRTDMGYPLFSNAIWCRICEWGREP